MKGDPLVFFNILFNALPNVLLVQPLLDYF